jgi:actin-related protein 6
MILRDCLARAVEDPSLKALNEKPCQLVIDSGFSFTYGVPFINKLPIKPGALRIDVGGKMLTNLLAETISSKQFNLQGEFAIVNHLKELTSFLCTD